MRITRDILLSVFGLLLCVVASASDGVATTDRSPGLLQYHHTSWSTRDGAPGPVLALAQTPDGRLWLGTPTGLFSYDGVEFKRMDALGGTPLRASGVRTLTVDRKGTLWIGYLFGGASRYAEGRLTNYGPTEGLPNATLARIAIGPDGSVWAAAVHGLYRLEGERWVQHLPEHDILVDVFVDRASRIWFISREQLFVHDPAAPAGQGVRLADSQLDDSSHLTEGPDGSLWVADRTRGLRRFGPKGQLPMGAAVPKGMVAPLLFDRDGMAWYMGQGMWRSDPAGWPQPDGTPPASDPRWFGKKEGLSGDTVFALLQDREGTVWAGTSGGLDRFRRNKLTRVPVAQDGVVALAPGAGADMWLAHSDLPLMRLGATVAEFHAVREKVWSLYADRDGTLWAGSQLGRIWHIDGDTVTEVPSPKTTRHVGHVVQAFTRDRAGRLWVACSGVFRQEDGRWRELGVQDGVPANDTPTQMHTDPQGRVWIGFTDSRLTVNDGTTARLFTQADGVDVGTVLAFASSGERLWIGGESGLAMHASGRFRPLLGAGGAVFHSVSGIAETAAGDLWLNTAEGVVRVPPAEVRRFIADPSHRPAFEVFDHRDGLAGRVSPIGPNPTLAAARDGRLWISTPNSVVWIDPAAIARNRMPAPVAILALAAGEQNLPHPAGAALPALTSSVQIRYTAFSLAAPERVRFRYRLDGVDADWQDAGTRRTAYYTNLGPGTYRFQVLAANEDGVWSEKPALMAFSIEPALHQTLVFRIACVLAGVALLAWLYVLRVRTLTARAAEKVRERQFERDRIAGELHDTLLQSVYGLLLQLQAVLSRLTDEGSRQALERAVEGAERLLDEGRDRVAGLRRSAPPQEDDLATALQGLASSSSPGLHLDVEVECDVQGLRPEVQDEIYFIAREALLNIERHAQARSASITLDCHADGMRLTVRDDGRGIAEDVLNEGGVPGHWGLRGMQERAARIGGTLAIGRRAEGGTEVILDVPRAAAYGEAPRRWLGGR